VCLHTEAIPVVQRTVQGLPLEFSRCCNCDLIYQTPRLTRESLSSYFSSDVFLQDPGDLDELLGYPDYLDWDKSYARTASLRLKRIVMYKQPPGELLEIGSATGSFLHAARSLGFSVRGLDLSSKFAAIARTRGLEVDVDYIEDRSLPESRYDVVCNFGGIACWRDPIRALKNIHRSLKADGILVMNYFDVDSLPGRILGEHHFEYNHASLVIFSNKTMQGCLRQGGFETIFSQNERQFATLGRIVGYLKQKTALRALRALRLDEITIPIIVPGTIFSICRKIPAPS
jgi:SAM-dependent methyltransferase